MNNDTKYYVIKTTKNGIKYKRYKCIEGWSTDKSECWKFSKGGAEQIAKSLNDGIPESWQGKVHYNTLPVGEAYWCVIQKYYDNGTVKVSGPHKVYSESMPESGMVENKLCDEYCDYFVEYDEAVKFAKEAAQA